MKLTGKTELSGHFGYRRLLASVIPMMLMMVVVSVYSIVDGLFISNFAGSDAFAGMNLVWPVIATVGALGIMIGAGGSALVSKTFGEGKPDKANRIFSMLVRLCVISGIILAVIMEIFMPGIVRLLGSDETLLPYAVSYGRILTVMMPLFMLQMAFQPFFMVAERPELGTMTSICCGAANIMLDALFVAVLKWGLVGAAIATALSFIVGGGFPLWYFSSERNRTQLKLTQASFEWGSIAKACTNGLSEFVGNIALNIVGICYNLQLMRHIGPDGVSAYGIIMYLGFIFAALFIGYNMGVAQLVSYNFGAGNTEELKSLLRKSCVITGAIGLSVTAVSVIFSPFIARCFVGYDESLCSLTVHATRIYMMNFLVCGFNIFTSSWFTALNNGAVSAAAAFVRTLVFELASVFILPAIFGIDGIWYSVVVAEVLALVLSAVLMFSFRRRYGY